MKPGVGLVNSHIVYAKRTQMYTLLQTWGGHLVCSCNYLSLFCTVIIQNDSHCDYLFTQVGEIYPQLEVQFDVLFSKSMSNHNHINITHHHSSEGFI